MGTPLMTPTQPPYNHIVAFEVSKDELVVLSLPADEQSQIANSAPAVRRLLKAELKRNARHELGAMLVVCEATGGYERHVLDVAIELGIAVHRAHGTRVRYFGRSLGLLAKTDPIDVRVIGKYALKSERLRLYTPPPPETQALRALHDRRHELQQMIIAETNRLGQVRDRAVLKCLAAHVACLRTALARIEAQIARLVRNTAELKRKVELMQTIKGIGPVSAIVLLAHVPDIGQLTKGRVARLTGLAPINDDSGKRRGARHVEPGRNAIKRVLYMAAVSAISSNPQLKAFADRLRSRGHADMYVVVAVMRKLVVIANAVLRDGKPWKGATKTTTAAAALS